VISGEGMNYSPMGRLPYTSLSLSPSHPLSHAVIRSRAPARLGSPALIMSPTHKSRPSPWRRAASAARPPPLPAPFLDAGSPRAEIKISVLLPGAIVARAGFGYPGRHCVANS